MRRLITSMLMLSMPIAPALAAESLPKFYVYGEDDTATELKTCLVSHALGMAVVQEELRGAGIVIQTDSKNPEAVMDAYVNLNAMPIGNSKINCTYNIQLAFESYGEVANPFSGATEFAKLTYCSKGSLLVWERASAQAEINRLLRDYVRICLDRYANRNKR